MMPGMTNTTGATEAYALRMTARELEIVKATADFHGCSLNTAIRFLIRRGNEWAPYRRPDGSWEFAPEAAPPVGNQLPYFPPQSAPPDVPEGQTTIDLEDQ